MLDKELMLRDGKIVFPSYMDRDERAVLRRQFDEERQYACCTCRDDVKLWYRLSKDLKWYPEEQGYVHAKGCIFAAEKDNDAYVQNATDGGAVVSLKFNPAEFTVSLGASGTRSSKNTDSEKEEKEKDPSLVLHEFVRSLNWDTFDERQASSKSLLSRDYYAASLFGRMKNVRINGLKKAIRDYTINDDGWQFFYTAYCGADVSEDADGKQTVNLKFKLADGREFAWFTYAKTYEVACKRFERMYGITVDKADNVVMAGMRYKRRSKYTGKEYNVVGRLCLFMVNSNGIYARSLTERTNLDVILKYQREHNDVRYFLAGVTDDYDGYFIKNGRAQKYILTGRRDISFGRHEVLHKSTATTQITEENITELLGRGKDKNSE